MGNKDLSIDSAIEKSTKGYNKLLALAALCRNDVVLCTILDAATDEVLDGLLILNELRKGEVHEHETSISDLKSYRRNSAHS